MKTVAWTPSPSMEAAEFSIEDEVIFYSGPAKVNKRMSLIGGLMVASAYAGMNTAFEIRNVNQEVLAVFEPGAPMKGYPAIHQALLEIAVHSDLRMKTAVTDAVNILKEETVRLYEQGVTDGVTAERERAAAAGAGSEQASISQPVEATSVAEATPEPQAPASAA